MIVSKFEKSSEHRSVCWLTF